MPKVYAIDGITPVVHPSAFVHPSARISIPGAVPLSELKKKHG